MFARDMYQAYEINDDWLINWLTVCVMTCMYGFAVSKIWHKRPSWHNEN